ncbi:MAG: tRNA lysidine(34) synthetase TilS, partial [Mollicutes bacterium]|nr:tRNA lysidine(34) synthetase TilS [Mollicutes bacterium]
NEFYLLDNLLQKRLLELILYNIYRDDVYLISDKHLKIILSLIDSEKQNAYVILPKNIKVIKFYNILEFNSYENISNAYNYILKDELKLELGTISKISNSDILKSNNIIRLNSKEIKLPLYVRTRRNGDKIEIKNLKGSKKIGDIFIDCKVPAKVRDIYPIVTDAEDNILWLPGLKKSKFDKQKNESYDIILEYKKKGD